MAGLSLPFILMVCERDGVFKGNFYCFLCTDAFFLFHKQTLFSQVFVLKAMSLICCVHFNRLIMIF